MRSMTAGQACSVPTPFPFVLLAPNATMRIEAGCATVEKDRARTVSKPATETPRFKNNRLRATLQDIRASITIQERKYLLSGSAALDQRSRSLDLQPRPAMNNLPLTKPVLRLPLWRRCARKPLQGNGRPASGEVGAYAGQRLLFR